MKGQPERTPPEATVRPADDLCPGDGVLAKGERAVSPETFPAAQGDKPRVNNNSVAYTSGGRLKFFKGNLFSGSARSLWRSGADPSCGNLS